MNFVESLLEGAILPIYKPLDWTSFDVVNKLKFALKPFNKKIKVGHAGTLDPKAEGLLIVCTGKMTKKVEEIQVMPKTYIANVELGATRPSFDMETEIEETFDVKHINEKSIRDVLHSFQGKQMQTPPQFSAVKIKGKPAYLSARKGKKVEINPKEIEIYSIELGEYDKPNAMIECCVSKGTYIRTLANDIGLELKSGAFLRHLVRSKIGHYSIEESYQINDIVNLIKVQSNSENI